MPSRTKCRSLRPSVNRCPGSREEVVLSSQASVYLVIGIGLLGHAGTKSRLTSRSRSAANAAYFVVELSPPDVVDVHLNIDVPPQTRESAFSINRCVSAVKSENHTSISRRRYHAQRHGKCHRVNTKRIDLASLPSFPNVPDSTGHSGDIRRLMRHASPLPVMHHGPRTRSTEAAGAGAETCGSGRNCRPAPPGKT